MSSLIPLITSFGYLGVGLVVFAESGFLLGLFLPGDSLLIAVGLLASKGFMNIWLLLIIVIVAAILGDNLGYATGRRFGPKVFSRDESFFFKKDYVARTEAFFLRHGALAIILARFTPIIRTFIPIMAGVGKMPYKTFLICNIVGGFIWGGGVLLAAYLAGLYIPGFEKHIETIIIVVIAVSLVPAVLQFIKSRIK